MTEAIGMIGAQTAVEGFAAEVEQGYTPAPLEQFLRESFGERGWLGRWLLGPWTYKVGRIQLFPAGGFFRQSCVFWVAARDSFLEARILPSGGTLGLFALGRDGLRYLNHRQDNVEDLLRREARALNDCAPLVLASLVIEALGRERNSSHDLLTSPEHFAAKYEGGSQDSIGGYELNASEWDRVRNTDAAQACCRAGRFGIAYSGWPMGVPDGLVVRSAWPRRRQA